MKFTLQSIDTFLKGVRKYVKDIVKFDNSNNNTNNNNNNNKLINNLHRAFPKRATSVKQTLQLSNERLALLHPDI